MFTYAYKAHNNHFVISINDNKKKMLYDLLSSYHKLQTIIQYISWLNEDANLFFPFGKDKAINKWLNLWLG